MAKMGNGYGSECHLLRFMGRHRDLLDQSILEVVGGDSIGWLDFEFNPKNKWLDAELKGLSFIPSDNQVHAAWRKYWPQGAGIQTWDAAAQVRFKDAHEWLLMEAKANLKELESDCQAKSARSIATIKAAFEETKQALGVAEDRDWLQGYYQFCNRLAVLHFLNKHLIPTHLLYIYFVGDCGDARRTCPQDESGWEDALGAQAAHVALPKGHPLERRLHKLFLPVTM
jgi:hypothetical protein